MYIPTAIPVDAIHFLLPNNGQPPNSGQRTSLVHQTMLSNRSAPPNNGQVGGAHVGGVGKITEDRSGHGNADLCEMQPPALRQISVSNRCSMRDKCKSAAPRSIARSSSLPPSQGR